MGYYTRVFSKITAIPSHNELVRELAADYPDFLLTCEREEAGLWRTLLLSHSNGDPIAEIDQSSTSDGVFWRERGCYRDRGY